MLEHNLPNEFAISPEQALDKVYCVLREKGYNYAIIGWAGPTIFYEKNCGAMLIPESTPASYGRKIDVNIE